MEKPELIERHFGKVADFHLSPRFWTPPPPWSKSFKPGSSLSLFWSLSFYPLKYCVHRNVTRLI
jgi:hypothetical protein